MHCPHLTKIPAEGPDCNRNINNNEADKPKCQFKGVIKVLKEGWCAGCVIKEKAKLYDEIAAEGKGLGSLLTKLVNPIEPKINAPKSTKNPETTIPKGNSGLAIHWEGKTRNEVKREYREKKMELLDQISVLKQYAVDNKADMEKIEADVKKCTDDRRAEEGKNRLAKTEKKVGNVEKGEDARKEKERKKAEKVYGKGSKVLQVIENSKAAGGA